MFVPAAGLTAPSPLRLPATRQGCLTQATALHAWCAGCQLCSSFFCLVPCASRLLAAEDLAADSR